MAKYGDVEIEFEGERETLKIRKAKDHEGKDVTNKFKRPAKFEAYDKDGNPQSLNLPAGTVIMTKHNPQCWWVCCADGWHVYCWG